MTQKFARWLHRQMAREDLNQTGLAVKLGVTQSAVSDWLRSVTEPRRDNIHKLAEILHLGVADIYVALSRIPESNPGLPESRKRLVYKVLELSDSDFEFCEATVDFLLKRRARLVAQSNTGN